MGYCVGNDGRVEIEINVCLVFNEGSRKNVGKRLNGKGKKFMVFWFIVGVVG